MLPARVYAWKHGSLTELLFDMPTLGHALQGARLIPPLRILNELLMQGVSEAGMSGGCRWKPFQISSSEYNELVEDLLTLPNAHLSVDTESQGPDNFNEWVLRTVRRRDRP
jgi:hypothetical protein